jgi:predicted ArsR family transcriptional regulator
VKLLSQSHHDIIELIKRSGPTSVDQATLALGLAKTAARRALLALERRGLLKREWIPSRRGRPKLAFTVTAEADKLFASKEAELLEGLIRYLSDQGLTSAVEGFFRSYWDKKYDRIMLKLKARKNRDLGVRMEILLAVLEDEGFFPKAELNKKSATAILTECHCPISAAAKITDIPCRMESRFIERVLNSEVKNPKGSCRFEIRRKKEGA